MRGLVLALLSESLINAFFQWRYDTALVFVRITRDVALTSTAIAVSGPGPTSVDVRSSQSGAGIDARSFVTSSCGCRSRIASRSAA